MYRLLCPQRFFVDVSVDVSVGVGVDVDVDVDRPNRRTTRDELATKLCEAREARSHQCALLEIPRWLKAGSSPKDLFRQNES